MHTRLFLPVSSALLPLLAVACGGDDEGTGSKLPASTADAIATYAEIVNATYEDTLTGAQTLDTRLTALVSTPTAASLEQAQSAWRAAREPYLQSEVFRFYDGPIDNPEDGPEGLLNAWPLDEQHIDYVVGKPTEGIVNDTSKPITETTLEAANEAPGEKDIATGYHAIEFLLWGQDTDPMGPGARPFTDYVTDGTGTAANQARRGTYLKTASGMLLGHLQQLVDAWAPNAAANYRASFEADAPAVALGKILSGMVILSGFETGGERVQAALDAQDQEEEHSCFSDNTHRDMVQDVRGVQNVWLGSYERLDGSRVSGQSLRDVIAATDADLAGRVSARIAESLSLAEALQSPFDREISPGNSAGNARVQALAVALSKQSEVLDEAFELYGLSRIPDPE